MIYQCTGLDLLTLGTIYKDEMREDATHMHSDLGKTGYR